MKTALLDRRGRLRTFALICETGDEVIEVLTAFARREKLGGSHFTAIGAFSDAVLGYFDWTSKDYRKIRIDEQVEVLSLVGDIAGENGKPKIHAHVVLGKSDATAHGGHLMSAHVRPTLEIVLTELPRRLQRRLDRESGLALIDLSDKRRRRQSAD
jgi:predicted DNA-binding protein with PD1-like motif